MTTEVAVMNKSAIALAGDSAVTIGNGSKFYNSANKLFTLSKYHPVGIMVYNNAEFMGYPIETIIKEYRDELGDNELGDLSDYWDNFVKYLENSLSSNNGIEDYLRKIEVYLHELDNRIKISTNKLIEKHMKNLSNDLTVREAEVRISEISSQHLEKFIGDIHNNISSIENDPDFEDKFDIIRKAIRAKTLIKISEIIGSLEEPEQEKVIDLCTMILTKKHHTGVKTGIVIAGFGSKNLYPKLISGEFMGVYFNKIKYIKKRNIEIDNINDASIIPFAQSDVIDNFMTGVDQGLKSKIIQIIDKYKLNDDSENDCIEKLRDEVGEQIESWSRVRHISPIVTTVKIAPKEELASMAETLVNLTSFRRKLSMDAFSQSVGGPIDVALITKGDGFIWIKRKHYFDLDKNPHFLENYYKKCKGGDVVEKPKE